ncbi:MAG: hypothetical protein KatS3mg031_0823 [Chitinophagales bacterium]|nr:MAG: hypothetical protein KatS3mg031_0823 [Chitinophagales bacterium]
MKLLICILTLIAFSTAGFAQEETEAYVFRIKVAASRTPLPEGAKVFKDFPEAEGMLFPDGYYRYFVGKFETAHRATLQLSAVKDKGYKDAYVVCIHQGRLLTVDEALTEIYEDR